MTFSLTGVCLFCGKAREVDGEAEWATLLSVFQTREKDGHTHRIRIGGGTVVTVCRECRGQHTVEELIQKAREVW